MPIVIERFSDDNPVTHDKLNQAMETLAGLVNALAGEQIVQLGAESNSGEFARLTGATFLGQVRVPSLLVGPASAPQAPVVTTNTLADEATAGAVRRAVNIAALTQSITNPPTQSEVIAIQSAVNDLLAALTNAGQMTS